MSSSLDPIESVFDGLWEPFVAVTAFFAISGGAHFFALMAHHVGEVLVQVLLVVPPRVLGSWAIPSFDPWSVAGSWVVMLLGSLAAPWVWPFLLLQFWIIVRLRSGADHFPLFLLLAVAQAIQSFIVLARIKSSLKSELAIGGGFLVAGLAVLVCLTLWWRHLQQTAPEPVEELEL